MADKLHFGLELGMGTIKLFSKQQGVQLVSQVAVPSGPLVGRLLELVNGQHLYSLGELDTLLRANRLDIAQALPIWEGEVMGEIEKRWGKAWRRFQVVILVGGGAVLLKNALPYFCHGKAILPADPIQSIASGLWKLSLFLNTSKCGGGER